MSTHRPKLGQLSQHRFQRTQTGFIQAALLFGIALMTAILGGFALANRSPTSQTDDEQAKVNASVVLKQGSDLRDGVSRFASDNGASSVQSISTLDFSANTTSGLFNVDTRYASPQIMPTSAFTATPTAVNPTTTAGTNKAGHWFLNQLALGVDIGTSSADPMVVLPSIQLKVCQRINRLLYGTSASAAPPASTNTLTEWIGDGAGATTGMAAATGPSAASGWPEGCVSASGGEYLYFKILQEN